jgi:anti-sigma factor RsiW
MSCISENTVMAFVEGLLAPEAAAQIERHAASCAACRRLLSELAAGISRLETARRAPDIGGEDEPDAASAPLTPPTEPSRGALVGRYVVLETLGSGGMGVVYAAYDPELDRKVALKLLREEMVSRSRELRARMMREAQALARLSHPNVVAVFDVGTFGRERGPGPDYAGNRRARRSRCIRPLRSPRL